MENSPIASNYYPVTSWIHITDKARQLRMLVFPDRPQGGTSLRSGELELMVHRWHSTISEDTGLREALEELGEDGEGLVARGTHRVFLGSASECQRLMRPQALQLVYRPVLLFPPILWKPELGNFTGLRSPLPSTLHVLTLERPSKNQVLLRLEHLALNKTALEVDVTSLLSDYVLENIRPVTLGANQFLPGPTRYRWSVQEIGRAPRQKDVVRMFAPEITPTPDTDGSAVKLRPGEIATFLADLVPD
ncbi:lysosomal alpha-mannosidase-like [Haemaphysalis longicornis]